MEELTIGQRIAAKRRELGISQIELGERMGVSRQSVSKWEADAAIPEIDKLIALSKLFCVSVGWLLGVENETQPQEPPETEFTDREWEIIDRLTQNEPRLPKWLLPLTAGAAAVSLCAAILAGTALWSSRSYKEELTELNRTLSIYTAGHEGLIPTVSVLDSYQFLATPSADLEECTFAFTGHPAYYEPGAEAELVISLGTQEIHRLKCQWDGAAYLAEFTVPARNGYTAVFELTEKSGIVLASQVYDYLLTDLLSQRSFGKASVDFSGVAYKEECLDLVDVQVSIEAPGILRDISGLWRKCDLVVLGDGRELGRLDLINRSKYSKTHNFGSSHVDFFTREQSIPIGPVEGIQELELLLVCELSTGQQLQQTVDTFCPDNFLTQ